MQQHAHMTDQWFRLHPISCKNLDLALQVTDIQTTLATPINSSSAPTCGRIMYNNGLARSEHKTL